MTTRVCEKLTPTPGVAASLHPSGRRDAGLPSVCRASSDVHRVAQSREPDETCDSSLSFVDRIKKRREKTRNRYGLVENDEEKSDLGRPRPKVVRIDLRARVLSILEDPRLRRRGVLGTRAISRREIDPEAREIASRRRSRRSFRPKGQRSQNIEKGG